MDNEMNKNLSASIGTFRLPRYNELTDTGLYLEQTTEYINEYLAPLGCVNITRSMISNYVKKGLVSNPVKKQYFADQIAHLISITILKTVIPLENISELFKHQQKVYPDEVAYNYFCMELENVLQFQFGFKDTVDDIGVTSSLEKKMLRSAIVAVSHIIYLDSCFRTLSSDTEE